jgi:hypothetical protein
MPAPTMTSVPAFGALPRENQKQIKIRHIERTVAPPLTARRAA